ncbi:MAG TPA: HupE/UreJ family protein [Vicinamibacterales bacterium]|nr:HupE/UreJ family protein [Vicinamibacterales bacterium]
MYLTYRSYLKNLSCVLLAALFFLSAPLSAHDIPADVLMQLFLKPEGTRLRLVVRAPIGAMRDVEFPLRGPGYLQLDRADPFVAQAADLWIANSVAIYEGETRLGAPRLVAARISLPSDRSFASYDEAVAHLRAPPLPPTTDLIATQGWLDVEYEYTIASDRAKFSINPTFARLGVRTVTALRFLPPDGGVSAFELVGDPGVVRIDPEWYQAAWRFVALGFEHILSGTDHLLFLFCLVIPFRKLRQLVIIVTSFTIAHSVTLIASAFGAAPDALWFPPLIETLIAVSIVYMALENIVIAADASPGAGDALRGLKHRWTITFAFGLVHGFGFSFALRQTLQFGGAHMLTSLLSFNVGVEIGQLLVLVVLLPALALLFRYVVVEKVGIILLSTLVGHTAWHWMQDRAAILSGFSWPAFDAVTALWAIRALMVTLVLFAGWRLLSARRRREKMTPGMILGKNHTSHDFD